MNIKINKKISNASIQIEIDEKEEKDAMAKMTFWTTDDVCLHEQSGKRCYSKSIVWDSNKAKTENGTFTYIKRRCLTCGATSTMGEYKEGGFFWKPWEIFRKDNQVSESDLGM